MDFTASVEYVKGIGPKTAEQLAAAGIKTVEDLIYYLPRSYSDFSEITPIETMQPGQVSLKVTAEHVTTKRVRRGMHITEAVLADASGKVRALWFNQPYRVTQLQSGGEFYVAGTYGFERNRYLLLNPSVEKVSDLPVQAGRIVPIYRQPHGLKSHTLRKVLRSLEPFIKMVPETLPMTVIAGNKLCSLADALSWFHFPTSMSQVELARERLAFEELLILQLAALLNKQANGSLKAWQIPFNEVAAKNFTQLLPFELTPAQKVAAWDIIKNLEAGSPMNRLLQGDVGAGKTVVAAMAAYLAAQAGYQTALMAPTEILASQHAETLHKILKSSGLTVGVLTGSVKGKARTELLARIHDGTVNVIIGTHALIQPGVDFHKLGFVVIDEQHRFGVKQRQQLLTKSSRMPHLLAMTATPIPRSLALTIYGELDISIINQLPSGRKAIKTEIHSPNSRAQMYRRVEQELDTGRQAYVICPKITATGELNEVKSVEAEYQRLRNSVFKKYKIGLLHGQLKADEKEAVMRAFSNGDLQILVATTVVEVGVDVPNATIMIIEAAERFGLAQLHQLRGRVGRGQHQSYCFLVPTTSQAPSQRLRELERSNDGFYLAERDLELRGPGEIYGQSQHGQLDLRVASLGDTKMAALARKAAEMLMNEPSLLQYEQLMKNVNYYRRLTTLN